MHVLFSLATGGLETQVVGLIRHSDRTRFRHSLCCLEASGPLEDVLAEPRPRVHVMGKKPGLAFSLPLRLARLFARERVDVVHAGGFGPYLYATPAAKLARCGMIYGDHGDLAALEHRARIRAAVRALAPMTNELYAVSEAGRRCLARLSGRPAARIALVPNGVDTERFRPQDPAPARRRLGLEADAFVVGFVGRLAPIKNLGALFRALPRVHEAVPGLAAVLVGAGPEEGAVRRLASASPVADRVLLLGERRDVPELLAAMSVFVLTSHSEAHPVALVEAMAAGLPAVAPRVGGLPEVVRDGETGLLFAPNRPDELAEHLIRLARSGPFRRRLAENARRVACRECSIQTAVARHEALYARAARRRRK